MLLKTAIFIIFYALPGGEIQTFSNWADVPQAPGLQYIVGCVDGEPDEGERYRLSRYRYLFHGSDFYCIEEGTIQSSKMLKLNSYRHHETLSEFITRSGCRVESLRFGLTLPDHQWGKLVDLARANSICRLEATP